MPIKNKPIRNKPIRNKLLVDAIRNGDVEKVAKLLKKNEWHINAEITTDSKKLTPLGYAIIFGQLEVVRFLLGMDNIKLSAGEVLFSEAEQFAKFYKQRDIANLIASHKAQEKVTQETTVQQMTAEQMTTQEIAAQLFLHLKEENFDAVEKTLATVSAQKISESAGSIEIVAKLINLLFMRSILSRWIISQKTKGQEPLYGNRDDTLNEDAESASLNAQLRNRGLRIIRQVIGWLCPELKDADDEILRKYSKKHQLETKRTAGDESDDSDSEDDEAFKNQDARPNTRTMQHKEIRQIVATDGFWWTTGRERQGGGLIEKLRKTTISRKKIDEIREDVFNIKRDRETLETPSTANQKRFVVQFSGINYMSDRWSINSRRYHYKMDEVGLPQFSESVLKTWGINFYTQLSEDNDYCKDKELSRKFLEHAHMLREALLALESSQKPVIESTVIGKAGPYLFNNIAEWMQHGFTNGISQHLLDLKKYREENKHNLRAHTLNSFNYAVSTSDCPNHALQYALGLKTYYADNFPLIYNQDGSILNSHVGKVYIVLQDAEEFIRPGYVRHVLRLAHEGKVPINKTGGIDIANELENDYLAYIPGDKVVVELRLKFPSFHKAYKPIYEIKYGLNRELYNLFGRLIKQTWQQDGQGPDNKMHQAAILLLKEWLCAYYEVLLLRMAQNKAKEMGGSLVYIHHDGSQQQTPDFVPFVNGHEHLPNRNRTRVLQNFRMIAGEHFSAEQHADVDLMIRLSMEEHLAKLVDGVKYEPTVPEGLAKITDSDTREYYLRINSSSVSDLEKKKEIAQDVLAKHKRTFNCTAPNNQIRPLLFSDSLRIDGIRSKRAKQELMIDQEAVLDAPGLHY